MTGARFPHRWRLHRAGIVNVWRYYDNEFQLSGGRMVLRGTNGSGKSRALEMLLPYLLDADRAKMDATGSRKVQLHDLMRHGAEGAANRLGYLWLELAAGEEFLTIGALVRWSASTGDARTWFFTTPLRVGSDLRLLDDTRTPLSREDLGTLIGVDRITDAPETHRETVRRNVFGLTDDSGRDRFAGLLQLLHTLRAPDVGNRIEEGQLPVLLSDALPPLSDRALSTAGSQLDALSETRAAQERLELVHAQVVTFLDVYRRYATAALTRRADEAREASRRVRATGRSLTEAARHRDDVVEESRRAHETVRGLEEQLEQFRQQISGLRESEAYRSAEDLADRERTVRALAGTATGALAAAATARRVESSATDAAAGVLRDLESAAQESGRDLVEARAGVRAAGLEVALPAEFAVESGVQEPVEEMIRLEVGTAPQAVSRPQLRTATVRPEDLASAGDTVAAAGRAAGDREHLARARRSEAADLVRELRAVEDRERRAEDAVQTADVEAGRAQLARDERDTAARELVEGWESWSSDEGTRQLLDETAHPVLDRVRADPTALTDDELDLDDLDSVAIELATPARERLTRRSLELETAEDADAAERRELRGERDRLAAAEDTPPGGPEWQTDTTGTPFWQLIDFRAHVSAADRDGVETAFAAAGLLTATLGADGVRAGDGQLLLTADGDPARNPLTALLTAEGGPEAHEVERVLARISTTADHPTWIGTDGSFRLGPLHGRANPAPARFVGAAARAAARERRIAEIDARLAALDSAARARTIDREALQHERSAIDDLVRRAPRTGALRAARERARTRNEVALDARRRSVAAQDEAAASRRAFAQAQREHSDRCRRNALPTDVEELDAASRACADAARRCSALVQGIGRLSRLVANLDASTRTASERRAERQDAEQRARTEHDTWAQEDANVAATRAAIGADAAQVLEDIRVAEEGLRSTQAGIGAARSHAEELLGTLGSARTAADVAGERAADAQQALQTASDGLLRRSRLPGLLAAAGEPVDLVVEAVTPAAVDAAVSTLREALDDPEARADETQLARARQNLDREIVGSFDVAETFDDGVRIVHLVDAEGSATLAQAAQTLERRKEEGAGALSARERQVFADFVLGGVAEELRVRMARAEDLVKAMNISLSTLTTSHGIGVRLRWTLQDSADSPVVRIKELVGRAAAMRPVAEAEELSRLLEQLVDAEFAADPSAGYTVHLRSALDYRRWHTVEVIITGPEPGQERRISRRAKLSQGETRFVSYVTLFAAADAYLSGLPETTLRLVLLDDAFAKVDDQTIGELLGLLVQLDLDFVLTGHALWGFYPQVPSIDAYEVRRGEGTAAVTTRVHWDGTNRHLGLE